MIPKMIFSFFELFFSTQNACEWFQASFGKLNKYSFMERGCRIVNKALSCRLKATLTAFFQCIVKTSTGTGEPV